ncbi:MAG TPA: MBL fold metallo-hydrolase [Candidatus Acidoferrum sp.]|nr:MBL fold metallo-hydrolase [Candidatus Acidoferrum sp.]
MKLTMIGHSTVLIEAAGKRILTDPYFGLHGNPAYARSRPPACTREQLSNVDLVLISHNHFDHVDRRFLRMLPNSVPVYAPSATAWMTRLKGGRNVTGFKPWERKSLDGIVITAVPARHVTFTIGYVIEAEGQRIYFAGDTYLSDFMHKIGKELRPNIALIPVTTFRIPMTMGEKQGVEAVRRLKPQTIIPIHLGIVPRSPLMRTSDTVEGFRERVHEAGLSANVVVLKEGESWAA